MNSGDGSDKKVGFKQNRPMNLVVAQSPLFMMPSGLSPSGLLNSLGFFSPLQVSLSLSSLGIIGVDLNSNIFELVKNFGVTVCEPKRPLKISSRGDC